MLDLHLPLSNESVLAPATSSVPLATTELRIGRRAEILFSCWQLVFDAPVAKFYTLLLSFSFLITTLHIITFLLILSLVYFSQLRVKTNFPLRIPPPLKTAAEGGENFFTKGMVKVIRIPPRKSKNHRKGGSIAKFPDGGKFSSDFLQ